MIKQNKIYNVNDLQSSYLEYLCSKCWRCMVNYILDSDIQQASPKLVIVD